MRLDLLTHKDHQLLDLCTIYRSPEDFKARCNHKYLIAKRKGLLKLMYPVHTCALPSHYINPDIPIPVTLNKRQKRVLRETIGTIKNESASSPLFLEKLLEQIKALQ